MKLIERPIYNLMSIDWKGVAFVVFGMTLLLSWAMPSGTLVAAANLLNFIFSFDFYEVKEVPGHPIDSMMLFPVRNNTYELLNVCKIIFWILTISMITIFLFKKPRIIQHKESDTQLSDTN